MKKIVLALLLIANSLFAVTVSQIMNANPIYARAYITQVDIRDTKETQTPAPLFLTKFNTVSYPYWTAGSPYTNLKYTGTITDWWYTQYYDVYDRYQTWYDAYINQNDLSRTYVYVQLQGYSINDVTLYKTEGGQKTVVPSTTFDGYTYPRNLGNGYWVFLNTNSKSVGSYEVKTHIQASDGTVDLFGNTTISRNVL